MRALLWCDVVAPGQSLYRGPCRGAKWWPQGRCFIEGLVVVPRGGPRAIAVYRAFFFRMLLGPIHTKHLYPTPIPLLLYYPFTLVLQTYRAPCCGANGNWWPKAVAL